MGGGWLVDWLPSRVSRLLDPGRHIGRPWIAPPRSLRRSHQRRSAGNPQGSRHCCRV